MENTGGGRRAVGALVVEDSPVMNSRWYSGAVAAHTNVDLVDTEVQFAALDGVDAHLGGAGRC